MGVPDKAVQKNLEKAADDGAQSRRFKKAVMTTIVVVFAVFIGLFLISGKASWISFSHDSEDKSYSGAKLVGRLWDCIIKDEDIDKAFENAGLPKAERDEFPEWFAKEICDPDALNEAYVNEDWSLVGFIEEDSKAFMDRFGFQLASKGWTSCGEDAECIATFTKEEGSCRWLMVECIEAENAASGVLHIRHS